MTSLGVASKARQCWRFGMNHEDSNTNGGDEASGDRHLDVALAYAARGWYVLPLYVAAGTTCGCGNPDCRTPGKHPHGQLVRHGCDDATTDATTIRQWFDQMPGSNVGIDIERSGLLIVAPDSTEW